MYLAGKILLTLYLYFISYFYTLSYPVSWTAPVRILVFYGISHCVCTYLQRVKIQIMEQAQKKNLKFGAGIFGLAFFALGIYFVAYYPGGLFIDTFNQWYQVDKNFLLDWHPAIHTVLFLKIPSMICDSLAFANFLQIIWLSLAMAYLAMVLESWGIRKRWCMLAIALGIFNPAAAITLSYTWKDTAMTIFAIVLTAQTIEIVFSKGLWLKKWFHTAVFGLVGAMTALMRHNAILLVGPLMMLIVVLYWKECRQYVIMPCIWSAIFVAGIKGPVYKLLNVQQHPQVAAEMLGVPMTILGNVLVQDKESLPEEDRAFLYQIGGQELWEEEYEEGNWNSAKWMGEDISNDVIEEVGTKTVLRATWHAIKNSPKYAYRAVIKLWEIVWKPFGNEVSWNYEIEVDKGNIYGYKTEGVPALQKLLNAVRDLSVHSNFLFTWGWHIGFYILILLFVGVSRMQKVQKWLLWIPVLCYDFGTAMVLCGPDFRFFVFQLVTVFPVVLAMLAERQAETN